MIFGFLLAICFNPFIWTAATQPRWSFLAIALPVMIWRNPSSAPNHLTIIHIFGISFLTWATASLLWSPNTPDAFNGLIQLIIVAEAFVLGARMKSLSPIFAGLALGLSVSSALILIPPLQSLVPHSLISTEHEGLLGNRNMLAEAAVLTAIGCIGYRLWWYIPGLLPAILMPSLPRGALLGGLAAFVIWVWFRSRKLTILLALLSICAIAILTSQRLTSVTERWTLWTDTINGLTLLGHGIGSYYFLFPFLTDSFDITLSRPEHPHNEILEIWFELGIVGVFLYAGLVATAYRVADNVSGCFLAAFVVIGMFEFPSHVPVTAFLAALVLGHTARNGASIWTEHQFCGLPLRSWYERKNTVTVAGG